MFCSILLYRVTLESEIRRSQGLIGHLTSDPRLQVLVDRVFLRRVCGGRRGLNAGGGFGGDAGGPGLYAAAVPAGQHSAGGVGSLAIPITTLAGTTGWLIDRLSAGVG